MPATIQELIEYSLINMSGLSEGRARIVSSRFNDIQTFLKTPPYTFKNLTYVGGRKIGLSVRDLNSIKKLQNSGLLNSKLSPSQNFIKLLATDFLEKQVTMIKNIKLEDLNANPMLITSLRLNKAEDIIRFYVYQTVSRSIVTSMGFLVQDLLVHSGSDIYDAKKLSSTGKTKWDLVKRNARRIVAWIEVKSGPNDLDKTQILHYKTMIERAERKGERGFIGETYGKRSNNTITHGLYREYLSNWNRRTLIGKELWTFVSGDKNYSTKLIGLMEASAGKVLATRTILQEIEQCISRTINEFYSTYGKSKDPVKEYLDSLW